MAKELWICFILILCVGLTGWAQKPATSPVEAALRTSVEKAATFWNAGDAAGLSRSWAEDGDLIDAAANHTKGRVAIEKRFTGLLGGPYRGSRMALKVDSIRFLSANVAVLDGHFELSGAHRADGSELPTEKGLFTDVIVKKSGKWAVAFHREMVPISLGLSMAQ